MHVHVLGKLTVFEHFMHGLYAVHCACWLCAFRDHSHPHFCRSPAVCQPLHCSVYLKSNLTYLLISNKSGPRFILCYKSKCSRNLSVTQAALFAITSAAEVLSRCIEGGEGADGPADEAAAASVAQLLLQLLLHLSAASTSLAHSRERVHLLELLLMQMLAPTLMHHVAGIDVAQAQVCPLNSLPLADWHVSQVCERLWHADLNACCVCFSEVIVSWQPPLHVHALCFCNVHAPVLPCVHCPVAGTPHASIHFRT